MRTPRKLNLGDLMILVLACACAAAIIRLYFALDDAIWFGGRDKKWWFDFLNIWRAATLPLIPLSLGVLAMRLRRPRPARHRIVQQPGFLACIAVPLIIIPSSCEEFITILIIGPPPHLLNYSFNRVLRWWMFPIGTAVFALWTGCFLAGRWRPEKSGIDRAGRILGIAWVACFLSWTWDMGWSNLDIYHLFHRLSLQRSQNEVPSNTPVPPPTVEEVQAPLATPPLPSDNHSPFDDVPEAKPKAK